MADAATKGILAELTTPAAWEAETAAATATAAPTAGLKAAAAAAPAATIAVSEGEAAEAAEVATALVAAAAATMRREKHPRRAGRIRVEMPGAASTAIGLGIWLVNAAARRSKVASAAP